MKRLRQDAEKSPAVHIAIAVLIAVGLASFPVKETMSLLSVEETAANRYLFTAAVKAVSAGAMLYLVFAYGFEGALSPKIRRFYLALPCFLVAANNFPVVALATGEAAVTAPAGTIALYLVQTFFVAAFEEIAFRGVVFPLCGIALKKKKHALFWAAALSSALFGAAHLVNLLGGADVLSVLLQVGYSFLLGGMCAVSLLITKSLFVPAALHFIFNAGGLLVEELGAGSIVNPPTIAVTAVLGAAVFALMLHSALKAKAADGIALWGGGGNGENAGGAPPEDRQNGDGGGV